MSAARGMYQTDERGYGRSRERRRDPYRRDSRRSRRSRSPRRRPRRSRSRSRSRRSSRSYSSSSSPVIRRKRKKTTGWDQKPTGAGFGAAPMAGGPAPLPVQATRQARRLYVGNLPANCSEEVLKRFFNDAMSRSTDFVSKSGDAVLSIYMNNTKKFGFVEFRSVEEATAAMALDGIMFEGMSLKVRRPSEYDPSQLPSEAMPTPGLDVGKLGIVSTQVPDGPHKVFCGGLPYSMTEEDVKELLQAFGALRAFHLVRDAGSSLSKGYCFFEYLDPAVTDSAVKNLNGIVIAGKHLTVRRAQARENMGGRGDTGVASAASNILVLCNMVTKQELNNDEEYKEIVDDIRSECSKFGVLKSLLIPREGPGLEKVILEYQLPVQAAAAREALEGRQFASRVISAVFLSQDDFQRKNF